MEKGQISAGERLVFILALILIGLIAASGSPAMADPPGWTITQLTNNGYDDVNPQISDSKCRLAGLGWQRL